MYLDRRAFAKICGLLLLSALIDGCVRNAPATIPSPAPTGIGFHRLVFTRYSGMGPGPSYTVEIDRQGNAQFLGCQLVPLEGAFKGTVSNDDLVGLSRFITAHDFFRKEEPHFVIDASGIEFEIETAARLDKVAVAHYWGPGVHDDLFQFGKILDGIVFTTRWYGTPTAPAYSLFLPRTKTERLAGGIRRLRLPPGCSFGLPR